MSDEKQPETFRKLCEALMENHSKLAEGYREASAASKDPGRELHLRIQLAHQQQHLTAKVLAKALSLLAEKEDADGGH